MAAAPNQNSIFTLDESNLTKEEKEINAKACGRIVFWSFRGSVSRAVLQQMLADCGCPLSLEPPDEPSDIVALHRACEAIARSDKLDTHSPKRGEWTIVGKPEKNDAGTKLQYDIHVNAAIDKDHGLVVVSNDDRLAERVRAQFHIEKGQLAPADIGYWLTRRLEKLHAVSMRTSGGFYFVPQPEVEAWTRIATAVKRSSKHAMHAIPALRSQDAVEAILNAITEDTQKACEEIAEGLKGEGVGRRALETREAKTRELLERVGKYEALLGMKLDALRDAVDGTQAAVATAMFALSANDSDGE